VRVSRLFRSAVTAAAALLIFGCLGPAEVKKQDSEPPAPRPEKPVPSGLRDGARRFEHFCGDWISKLEKREQANERNVQLKKTGKRYVGEFTGYGRAPLRCTATPTGKPVTPLVGRLGYHEIRYQKSGATRAGAKKSKPRELYRIEVTELFRYDGKSWVY
jgi:hypothetical protein